jgi:GGDEF domain-containing protein
MLAGFVASLVLGVLGGYILGRTWSRPALPLLPPEPLKEQADPRLVLPTVEEEIARALRQGAPLSLVYLAWETRDAADPTLRLIASLLVRLVRPYDAIVPLGDGRFVLVLPQVGEAAADTVAARLIQELRLLASVQLTSSETELPRISLSAPASVKRLLDAAVEAAELAPPWRGDRGQLLRIGMAVLERPEVQLLASIAPGTLLRLKDLAMDGVAMDGAAGVAAFPPPARLVRVLEASPLRVRCLEAFPQVAGDRVQIVHEQGRNWMRAEVEVREAAGGDLGLSLPVEVHRVPRRRAERFRMRLPVQLADLEGFTLNLSADGFRAVFPLRAFAPGQVLDGGLALPEERHPVRVEVIKIRAAEHTEGMIVGCRFLGLEPQAHQALVGLLGRQTGGS